MAVPETTTPQDDAVDLRELLGTLVDHKWLIGIVTSMFLMLGVGYAVLGTPIYQADALVQVEQKVPSLPGLSAITQTLGASSSESTTEIALITSRSVIGKAVDELGLQIEAAPYHLPIFGAWLARHFVAASSMDEASPPIGMSRYDWGGSKLDIFQMKVPASLEEKELLLVAGEQGGYSLYFDGEVMLTGGVGHLASGHGISIQVRELRANPGTHFKVVHHTALAVINRLQIDINAAEQGKESGIIQLSYEHENPDLAVRLLDHVTQAYVKQNVDRNSAEAASSLAFVREQLPRIRLDLDKAQSALNAFQTKARSVDITLQTKGLLDQAVAIETSIQQLRMQQADMERRFTAAHPAYKALLEQIGQLQAQKGGIDKQVGGLPDTQQELLRLTRDVEVLNATYTGLLNQAQQLDIARAGTVGNVRVIDPAAVDVSKPAKPKKALLVLGSIFLGAFLAVGFVLLRQMLRRGVEDPSAIEQLGLAVYASIPNSVAEKQSFLHGRRSHADLTQRLLAVNAPADLAVEALRSLRTSLHFARIEAKNNVLMISGASPGAGKTFVASNLAAVIAKGGMRVLLIDGDLRKGALHTAVGGRPDRGLSELIAGRISVEEAVRQVPDVQGLYFMARGKAPPNPSELLMHARFADLLEAIKPQYDLVIIDTPPILAVTDAAIMGHHVGTSLLVIRFGLNQAREIALAKQRFEQNGVQIKGAVFNAVERRSTGYYSYGYYEYRSSPG
ncbi:polysaccharide biosynthesis tyrosine autokinase [Dyella kyungheensis]|jgi:tyrosine-protein kinase Etk/Wzc|uniref:Polysaccharide biosynthesis tyrosine autokinase n=1 Tax=Dyella kyungheensis TaxID=1242174 RepID=A0ABS2JW40_9GAMM|nr:polysaccharide biosynthesis tyrosine autokinase [Dyella kyungheensis]MBM7122809.1 polysaccharide biosynthesis tyrosine autokinase [Dyella kyungheensis]